jgi:hypothetical protein
VGVSIKEYIQKSFDSEGPDFYSTISLKAMGKAIPVTGLEGPSTASLHYSTIECSLFRLFFF